MSDTQPRSIGAPLILCGHPKSGTTLFRGLLEGHSELLVLPKETFFLSWAASHVDAQIDEAAAYLEERLFDGDGEHRAPLITPQASHPREVLEAAVRRFGIREAEGSPRYWIEKTPGNETSLRLAKQWFPGLRAIYIARDPRDVYHSYALKKERESNGERTLPLQDFIYRWGMSVWAWRYFCSANEGCLTLRYEDLVQHPREILAVVTEFLGIDYEEVLEIPMLGGEPWGGNSMHGEHFSGVSKVSVGRWRDGLQWEVVSTIETFLRWPMASLGYVAAGPARSFSSALRTLWSFPSRRKRLLGMLIRLNWPFALPRRLRPSH